MNITVEISLYPIEGEYSEPIMDFIERLKGYDNLDVVSNATSTLMTGEHSAIFDILKKETKKSFENGKNIFVLKVIGFERDIHKSY